MRMHHIVICGVPDSTIFLHTFSYATRFKEQVFEYETCVLILFTNLSETCHILRRNELDMMKNVYGSSCK
jgi:hypothetical protein